MLTTSTRGRGTLVGLNREGLAAAAEQLLKEAQEKRDSSRREWARRRLENADDVVANADLAWRRRHPTLAAEQRKLRKSRAELLNRWDHKNEGTPETHEQASRRNQGALVQLYRNETIDSEQLASAVEIAMVAERIGADVAVKTASLETRVDVTRHGDHFFERLGQVRREAAYTEWRSRLANPAAVLDMLVGEPIGYTIVAKRHRMSNKRALRLLIHALDIWPEILGAACKSIDRPKLDAAHAELAA